MRGGHARNPFVGVGEPVGMRNAGGVFGDAAVGRERDDGFSVLEARRTQNKPLGLEDGGTAFAVGVAELFQQGHGTGSWLKRKGDPASRLPLQEPDVWVRRFGLDAGGLRWSTVYSAAASVIGTTDTKVRPLALVWYWTRPSIRANSVWSLPMPTLSPACHWVPRWRTMMLPARQCSPPKSFTPRRWPAESRPLRDDPPAFLCAIWVSWFDLGSNVAL